MSASDNFIKIVFRLEQDSNGYPPANWEGIWAEPLDNGKYRLENIPFFAQGISWEDIVEADWIDKELRFQRVFRASGHSTVRVIVFEEGDTQPIRDKFKELGCDSEGSHIPSLFALDIPPDVDYRVVKAELDRGIAEEKWDYEEANIQHVL